MNSKRTTFTELVIKGLLLFSILTVLQGLPFFDGINRIWLTVVCLALAGRLITYHYSLNEFITLVITLILHIIALCFTDFPMYNFNMLFYFLLWVLLYVYFAKSKDTIVQVLDSSRNYINGILWTWTILVGITAFLPSSYQDNYFFSLAGTSFRLMPAALIITALAMYMVNKYNDRRYNLFLVLPTYAAFMNQSRTYFGVYILLLVMYMYMRMSKRQFYLTLIPCSVVVIFLMRMSGIGDKLEDVWNSGGTLEEFLAAFTNARTIFWKWDLDAFFELPVWQQFVGNGFNFAYDVTAQHQNSAIWAHNDFINILMNFGYIGVAIYLWAYLKVSKALMARGNKIPSIVKVLFHGAVFLNSMMNMSYTYFCAVIAYPLFLCTINARYIEE